MPITLVEMRNIVKYFPGVLANDHINFTAWKGEIHGLLGENGAGKTTLMNILYGLYQPDQGEIYFEGKRVIIQAPQDAIRLGIGMVHQHFMLIPRLTVAENIVLGLKSPREPFLAIREAEDRIQQLSEEYGLKVNPRARVWELSVGEEQRVEILKALYRNTKLLILDEPTAVLTPQEVDRLFEALSYIRKKGCTIIFISHKLKEVKEITDRVTVLRNGKVVATFATTEVTEGQLAKLMVGRDILLQVVNPPVEKGKRVLAVQDLSVYNDKGLEAVKKVSFSIHEGEILGLAGVSGNGQNELVEALVGLRKVEKGRVWIYEKEITNLSPRKILEQGVGYIPEDRLKVGIAVSLSVAENLILRQYRHPEFSRGGFFRSEKIKSYAQSLVDRFNIKTPSLDTPAGKLSGGNLQKLILAREISQEPRLLIAVQPTRGLDVGATEYIQTQLLEQKQRGTAILLVSEDLEEIFALSDQIAVIYEGQIAGIVPTKEADREQIGLMMAGG
jgi:simple sugar transport system ATP-binding protein